jgi:hypothetical protein
MELVEADNRHGIASCASIRRLKQPLFPLIISGSRERSRSEVFPADGQNEPDQIEAAARHGISAHIMPPLSLEAESEVEIKRGSWGRRR